MKTTIQIPDSLMAEAKREARREKTTFQNLVAEALRRLLEERSSRKKGFVLRDASFQGQGLRPEWRGASWESIRGAIYEGRGD
jgi:Arc/MetJ family transcription regulator